VADAHASVRKGRERSISCTWGVDTKGYNTSRRRDAAGCVVPKRCGYHNTPQHKWCQQAPRSVCLLLSYTTNDPVERATGVYHPVLRRGCGSHCCSPQQRNVQRTWEDMALTRRHHHEAVRIQLPCRLPWGIDADGDGKLPVLHGGNRGRLARGDCLDIVQFPGIPAPIVTPPER